MNADTTIKKAVPFTFDLAFDREGKSTAAPAPPKRKTLSLDEIEAIRREAHEAGLREGEASAARRQADALAIFSQHLENLAANLEEAVIPARSEAVTLAYVIALKLAHVLLRQQPRAEIEALIAHCIEEQKSEPHIVLRVNDMLHDDIKDYARKLVATRGFQGKIHVIGEPNIPAGDCTIEWADGGLERRLPLALGEIDKIVRGYLKASGDENPVIPSADDVTGNTNDGQTDLRRPNAKDVE